MFCCLSRFWPQVLKPQAPKASQAKTSQELRPGGLFLELFLSLDHQNFLPKKNMGEVDLDIGFLWETHLNC